MNSHICLVVDDNLQKLWKKWRRFYYMPVWEGDYLKTSDIFYDAVVQYVFLFGLYMWVVTPPILRVIERLHNWVMRLISSRGPWRQRNGSWAYPSVWEALAVAVLGPVSDYITRQQNTVEQYIPRLTIYEILVEEERMPV